MRLLIAVILFILLLVISTIFALNNDQQVVVNYLFGETQMSQSLLVFICTFIGLLLGILVLSFGLIKTRMQLKRTQKKLAKAEQEINNLRTLPIKDHH